MALLIAPREGEFAWHEVSTRVNRVANDDAQLLLPITDEQRAEEVLRRRQSAPRRASRRRWREMMSRGRCFKFKQ